MPFSVEAAIISKKGAAQSYNTDAVNAAGKVWPAEVLHGEKGIRVAGSCADKPYYVLASSLTKGTAQSAADLFQNCAEKFNDDGSNYSAMLSDYLKAFSKVLVESGFDSADCAFSIFAGVGDNAYVAKSGTSRLYAFYDGTFTEIEPQMAEFADQASGYGIAQCSHVKPGDLFLLLNGSVAGVFPNGLLKAICERSEGDVRKIVSLINSQAAKYGCTDAVSAVAVKVTQADAIAMPPEEDPDEASAISAAITAAFEEKNAEKAAAAIAAEEPDVPVNKGKRIALITGISILAVAFLVLLFFMVKGISQRHFTPDESTSETTLESTDTTGESESTSEPESTTQKDEPSSEEPATAETTTKAQETTTRRSSSSTTTTRRSNPTTTTRAPETTTEAPATTEATEPTDATEPVSETEATQPTDPTNATEPTAEPTSDAQTESPEPSGNTPQPDNTTESGNGNTEAGTDEASGNSGSTNEDTEN